MPLDPNNPNADTPHARTVHLASQGWRCGCHSARRGIRRPRGGQTRYVAHPWSANAGRLIVTEWLPRSCCHSERATDAACEGCANRGEK